LPVWPLRAAVYTEADWVAPTDCRPWARADCEVRRRPCLDLDADPLGRAAVSARRALPVRVRTQPLDQRLQVVHHPQRACGSGATPNLVPHVILAHAGGAHLVPGQLGLDLAVVDRHPSAVERHLELQVGPAAPATL